jgi:hypothetical protein
MTRQGIAFCSLLALLLILAIPASAKSQTLTTCRMDFELKAWSLVVKSATGDGAITCDNGQQAAVKLRAKGAGLAAGKYAVRDGHGKFSQVSDISELFGSYAAASANAGVEKSGEAAAMTKGSVSLALAGKGTGFDLGVSVERFTITPLR